MTIHVVTMHGISRTPKIMAPMADYLRQKNYFVHNIGYPSTQYPVEVLAKDFIRPQLSTSEIQQAPTVHFVLHSLSNIIMRYYLSQWPIENLGRIVMVAPPNHGSEITDWIKRWWLYKWLMGPAGQQLSTAENDLPKRLGPLNNVDFGVIAGNRNVEPWFAWLFKSPNDSKVSVESTRLTGMNDHIIMNEHHAGIVKANPVMAQVGHYLEQGAFAR